MATYYAARNPYRNSTGGLNLNSSPDSRRTQIIIPVRPSSPADSDCSSCDSSLHLNTPWSSTPAGLSIHLDTERDSTTRNQYHLEGRHSEGHLAPLVINSSQHISSAPRSAPLREHQGYDRTLITPASSSTDRYRSASTGHRRSASTSYTKYHHNIEHLEDEFRGDSSDIGRRGRTRFPRRLVSREAVEELGLPWSEEHDGAIVVLRALDRTEIDQLVGLAAEIRRRRYGTGKSVTFLGEATIHDRIPRAPSPPPLVANERIVYHHSGERPLTSLTSENVAHLNSSGQSHNSSFSHITTTTTTTTTEEPIFVPIHITAPGATNITTTFTTPSFPLPQSSLSRAEEKAIKAEEKAQKLEVRAGMTGSRRDEQEAHRARAKAEERRKRFEEKEWKERAKRDDKDVRRRDEREDSVRITKTHTRERERSTVR